MESNTELPEIKPIVDFIDEKELKAAEKEIEEEKKGKKKVKLESHVMTDARLRACEKARRAKALKRKTMEEQLEQMSAELKRLKSEKEQTPPKVTKPPEEIPATAPEPLSIQPRVKPIDPVRFNIGRPSQPLRPKPNLTRRNLMSSKSHF